jgi:hypothetical protein
MLQLAYISAFVAIIAVQFYGSELSNGVRLAIDLLACTGIVVVLLRRHNRAASLSQDESKTRR